MRVRGDHRQLREEPDGLELDLLGVVDVHVVLVVRRQGADGAREDRHRVRRVRQGVEQTTEVLVQQRVPTDAGVEGRELGLGRELAVDEEPGHLEEGQVRRDLVDRVAAVPQDPLVAVDVGDGALRRPGVHEPVVERVHPGLLLERRDVDGGRTVDARQDRELRRATRVRQRRGRRGLLGGGTHGDGRGGRCGRLLSVIGSVSHDDSLIAPTVGRAHIEPQDLVGTTDCAERERLRRMPDAASSPVAARLRRCVRRWR